MLNIGEDLIGSDLWAEYKDLISDAHRTFAQKEMIWKRNGVRTDRYGEDVGDKKSDDDVTLLVLLNDNYRRSWPINEVTVTGEQDQESTQVFINKEYLRVNDFLNDDGYFDYNMDDDRFIIDGLEYEASGDTPTAQMQSDDALITIILKRTVTPTGEKR